MNHPIVYYDTSFIIGLLDNVGDRRQHAREVIRYERSLQAKAYTSIITINEYAVKYYDKFSGKEYRDKLLAEAISNIRDIAEVYSINDEVALESARLMSVWGKQRQSSNPPLPRDRKFRWDAFHLATANILKAERIYAFDKPWNEFPSEHLMYVGKIICPARSPQASLEYEREKQDSFLTRGRLINFDGE